MDRYARYAARLLTAVVAGAALLMTPQPAAALSCVGPSVLATSSGLVLTGRVVAAEDERVLVEVDEVWSGPDVGDSLVLEVQQLGYGGEIEEAPLARGDGPWLFAPTTDAAAMTVDECSAVPLGERQVRRLRPADARAPTPTTAAERESVRASLEPEHPSSWLVVGAGTGTALLAAGLALARRRSGQGAPPEVSGSPRR